jgi:AraC family transcriptional regulator
MAESRAPSSKIELRVLRSQHAASVRTEVPQADLSDAIGGCLQAVREALRRQGVEADGAPFVRYHAFGDSVDLEAGMRVTSPVQPDGLVKPSQLPGGPAAIAIHVGPYETLKATYDAVERWLAATPHRANGGPWELYITDPTTEPDPGRWVTEVIQPLRPG